MTTCNRGPSASYYIHQNAVKLSRSFNLCYSSSHPTSTCTPPSDGVYLVDADGGLRLSLWVGSAASRDDKRGALHSATIYAQKVRGADIMVLLRVYCDHVTLITLTL